MFGNLKADQFSWSSASEGNSGTRGGWQGRSYRPKDFRIHLTINEKPLQNFKREMALFNLHLAS